MPPTTSADALTRQRDRTEKAVEVIDRDPEEAAYVLEPVIKAGPNVGEITQHDMFLLMSQMQQQMAGMQEQIVRLSTGDGSGTTGGRKAPDTAAELNADRVQRELTLESWKTEPREPVFLQPDQDEEKIRTVTGAYPPRVFGVNGLQYPITPGQIETVPSSIARLVEHTQKKRPYSSTPQGLPAIADPQRSQFLAAAQSMTIGNAGHTGNGRIQAEGLPPRPAELGLRYDHNGQ